MSPAWGRGSLRAGAVSAAQTELGRLLAQTMSSKGLSVDLYRRYLSMQYHLTRGVQRYFLTAAADPALAKRRRLRRFLFEFANEEELHYLVAANDLHKLALELLPEPLDVTLWHSYFSQIVVARPFIRLGAACVLENISAGSARSFVQLALKAPFLTRENTKFLVLHQHETLPHGEQIIAALAQANLEESQLSDVVLGARQGTVMYLRMAQWALDPECLSAIADSDELRFEPVDRESIKSFRLEDLSDDPS